MDRKDITELGRLVDIGYSYALELLESVGPSEASRLTGISKGAISMFLSRSRNMKIETVLLILNKIEAKKCISK